MLDKNSKLIDKDMHKLTNNVKHEIKHLEKEIKYYKITNYKKSFIKNFKFLYKVSAYLTTYNFLAAISMYYLSKTPFGMPVIVNDKKAYLNTSTNIDSLGNELYTEQYTPFNANNEVNYYDEWIQREDGTYERVGTKYYLKKLDEETALKLINKEISINDIKYSESIPLTEIKKELEQNDFYDEEYINAIIYSYDKNTYTYVKESNLDNVMNTICVFIIVAADEVLYYFICGKMLYKKLINSLNKDKQDDLIMDKHELEFLLDIKKDNYKRLMR